MMEISHVSSIYKCLVCRFRCDISLHEKLLKVESCDAPCCCIKRVLPKISMYKSLPYFIFVTDATDSFLREKFCQLKTTTEVPLLHMVQSGMGWLEYACVYIYSFEHQRILLCCVQSSFFCCAVTGSELQVHRAPDIDQLIFFESW